jgi:hypothetical protein
MHPSAKLGGHRSFAAFRYNEGRVVEVGDGHDRAFAATSSGSQIEIPGFVPS